MADRTAPIRIAVLSLLFVAFSASVGLTGGGSHLPVDQPPEITIVYPADSQAIGPVDSTAIRGSVTPGALLTINGDTIPVYRTGGFLAYLPVAPGEFAFHLKAENAFGIDTAVLSVFIADLSPIPPDSGVLIRQESIRPLWTRTVRPDDEVGIGFQGTHGCRASFEILSPTDTLGPFPMTELGPPPAGDYGRYRDILSRLPDSMPPLPDSGGIGRYHGIWRVPGRRRMDTLQVRLTLIGGDSVSDTASFIADGRLLPVATAAPRVVELTDSVQILRMGPRLGYMTIFQPFGVRARWWGEAGPWTIIAPAPGYEAWIETGKTRLLPEGTPPPGSLIAKLSTKAGPQSVRLEIGTSERLPFKVRVADDLKNVEVTVFGATANTDWIAQDPEDDMITDVSWTQTRPGVYEINLRLAASLWGYDAHYDDGRLIVEFRRPPVVKRDLAGLRIAVDAGHSADNGAIGPTGMLEKDANLRIAWKLKRYLERKGAYVIMTRRGDEDVPLYDRPAKALAESADLFISVHNNSVPDGVNPFARNGTGTFYYHPFARDLARAVQQAVRAASKLDDYGVTHGNFAVIRPTQYPSILVECAFIIIPDQEEMLGTDEFATRLGRGIAQGVQQFVRDRLRD